MVKRVCVAVNDIHCMSDSHHLNNVGGDWQGGCTVHAHHEKVGVYMNIAYSHTRHLYNIHPPCRHVWWPTASITALNPTPNTLLLENLRHRVALPLCATCTEGSQTRPIPSNRYSWGSSLADCMQKNISHSYEYRRLKNAMLDRNTGLKK